VMRVFFAVVLATLAEGSRIGKITPQPTAYTLTDDWQGDNFFLPSISQPTMIQHMVM